MYKDIYNCICQNTKKIRFIIHYVILEMIRCLKLKSEKDWDVYLPHITSAILSLEIHQLFHCQQTDAGMGST